MIVSCNYVYQHYSQSQRSSLSLPQLLPPHCLIFSPVPACITLCFRVKCFLWTMRDTEVTLRQTAHLITKEKLCWVNCACKTSLLSLSCLSYSVLSPVKCCFLWTVSAVEWHEDRLFPEPHKKGHVPWWEKFTYSQVTGYFCGKWKWFH